ncbi:Methyl-CpG DNA binding protein [Corchorus olitorius]|uniref:Methyl-CpG DNA binding protein n=1 Tax=Corchorus olitorius TaxID=93759 RepID=A0A1R3GKT7_9ROSI|nr:Methyl-CpG DNA binding protein [Corchorus olitorius]
MTGKTSPDWLPTGWALQSKVQKTGRSVTHYVNLATGQKFFTKDDLIRYTKSESYQCLEQQLNQRQTKKPSAKSHMNNAVSANDHPEWLPKNWFVEFKTFKSGMRMGKPWKIYVDSSTGFRFYSKPETAVNENERPEWLPKNWLMEFKTRQGGATIGRKFKIYVDPSSGSKFFSKPQAVTEKSTVNDLPEGSIEEVKIRNSANKVKLDLTAVKENEHPEWLPKNWLMECKTRQGGATIGRKFKIYVDPSSGSKFFSKPQAVTEKSTVDDLPEGSIEEVKIRSANKVKLDPTAVQENEHPEWLPKNWFIEFKTRQSGMTIGKRYKIYVDPSTGSRFFSQPQVLRFLNRVGQKNRKSKQKKRAYSTRKAVTEKSTVDDLPEGWIKEVKIRRSANKQDPYYTDPATGYVFRSKKDALRYIETGEISKRAFLPKEKHSDDPNFINNEKSQLPAAKRQKVEHLGSSTMGQLCTGKGWKIYKAFVISNQDEYFNQGGSLQPSYLKFIASDMKLIAAGSETSERSILSHQKGNTKKDHTDISLATASLPQIPQRKGSIETAIKLNPETAESGTGKRSNMNSKKSGKSDNKKVLDLPRRFSERLAQLEHKKPVISGHELVKPCQKEANGPCDLEGEAFQQPNISSNAKVAKHASADSTVKSHLGSVKKTVEPIENKDVLGNQLHMLQTGKTCDTKSKAQPFVCSDPSPAFKNLTGAIPLQAARNEGLVSAPASNVQQKKNRGKTRMDANTRSRKRERKSSSASVDKATRQLKFGSNNTKLPNQDSAAAVNPEVNSARHHDGAILGEQPQMSRTQKGSDSKLELQPLFCSDPCLEFAIKTLTGAIPLEDAINKGLTSTPIANIQPQKNPPETRIEHKTCRRALFNSSRSEKKDFTLPHRSSKRLAGHNTPELVANSGLQSSIPCFEFTSKSVTGSIVEETFTLHNYFPQQVGSSGSQRDGNLAPPDYGPPNVFPSDISSHSGAMAQPVVQHQVPVNPSFPAPGNLSLPTCSTVVTQQPYTKENKELPGNSKVKS